MLDLVVIDELEKHSASERQKKDYELWKSWQKGGQRPDDFRPLLKEFKNMIRKRANQFAGQADLPKNTIHAEYNKAFLHACKRYDPNRGAGLGTWVEHNLQKAQRWIQGHQDPTRIAETRYYKIGAFQNAVASLDDQLGREPSMRELSEHLGWPQNEVGRMQNELRPTLHSSGFQYDPTSIMPSREAEVVRFTREHIRDPIEQLVFDYTAGTHGMPKLRPGEIAKKLNLNPSKVTRIRNKIAAIMDKYSRG